MAAFFAHIGTVSKTQPAPGGHTPGVLQFHVVLGLSVTVPGKVGPAELPVEYYSTPKRSKILIRTTTWMDLENITLSERRQSQKITYYMIPFI